MDNGPDMSQETLQRTLDGLLGESRQMVRMRIVENDIMLPFIMTDRHRHNQQVTPPGSPPRMRPLNLMAVGSPPSMRTAPQFIELIDPDERRFPAAELRPRAIVRPSALLQQIYDTTAAAPKKHKKSSIGKARFENMCKETCFCLENHTNGEILVTDCGHTFGNECWKRWMTTSTSNKTCPTCRKFDPSTTIYTMRAERKAKTAENI